MRLSLSKRASLINKPDGVPGATPEPQNPSTKAALCLTKDGTRIALVATSADQGVNVQLVWPVTQIPEIIEALTRLLDESFEYDNARRREESTS